MSKVRDRTEDFKDVAHRSALSLGYDESKTAALLASFIMHKPRQRSGFTRAALKTLESIGTLEQFLKKHKKDYVDLHRTTEQERDSIEHEVTIFVKSCKEQIDILRNSINEEDANSKGWLGMKGDSLNADTVAHKHGVVLILSEKLHSVTSQFDQLRAIRFQDAINRVTPRRKRKNTTKSNTAETAASSSLDTDMKRDSEGPWCITSCAPKSPRTTFGRRNTCPPGRAEQSPGFCSRNRNKDGGNVCVKPSYVYSCFATGPTDRAFI